MCVALEGLVQRHDPARAAKLVREAVAPYEREDKDQTPSPSLRFMIAAAQDTPNAWLSYLRQDHGDDNFDFTCRTHARAKLLPAIRDQLTVPQLIIVYEQQEEHTGVSDAELDALAHATGRLTHEQRGLLSADTRAPLWLRIHVTCYTGFIEINTLDPAAVASIVAQASKLPLAPKTHTCLRALDAKLQLRLNSPDAPR
jgi:hypothetical protein